MLNRRELITLGATCALSVSGCGLRKVTTDEETSLIGEGEAAGELTAGATLAVACSEGQLQEILEDFCAPVLAERGATLECVVYDDVDNANDDTLKGEVACSLIESKAELNRYNSAHDTSSLISVGAVLYEPFGIYSKRLDTLMAPPAKTTIAIPSDLAGGGHALQVLAQEQLIVLKDPIALAATLKDVVENPYQLDLKPTDAGKLIAALDTHDACVIPPEVAFEEGLAARDAVVLESNTNIAAQWYGPSLVAPSLAAHDGAIQALLQALRSLELSYFLEDRFDENLLQIAVVLKDSAV